MKTMKLLFTIMLLAVFSSAFAVQWSLSIEAEDTANYTSIEGDATIGSSDNASGGHFAKLSKDDKTGVLQVIVNVPATGDYTMNLHHFGATTNYVEKELKLFVNGVDLGKKGLNGAASESTGPPTQTPLTATLQAGDNTIRYQISVDRKIYIDKVEFTMLEEEAVDTSYLDEVIEAEHCVTEGDTTLNPNSNLGFASNDTSVLVKTGSSISFNIDVDEAGLYEFQAYNYKSSGDATLTLNGEDTLLTFVADAWPSSSSAPTQNTIELELIEGLNTFRLTSMSNNVYDKFNVTKIYYITYHNVGTRNVAENVGTYTIEDALTLAEPSDSTGYTFAGWFTDAACAPADTVSTPAITTGSIGYTVFYTKWAEAIVTDISTVEKTYFSFYPNPAQDVLHLTLGTSVEAAQITISSLSGQLVKTMTVGKTSQIDVSDLAADTYILSAAMGNEVCNQLFIRR